MACANAPHKRRDATELIALRKVRDAAVAMATLLDGYDHDPQDLSGRLLAAFKEALEEARKVSGQ